MTSQPPTADDFVAQIDLQRYERHGYLIVRRMADAGTVQRMRAAVEAALDPLLGPAEFEADVHYPGAPASRLDEGGETPRRLLHAMTRDAIFRDWATSAPIARRLMSLLGGPVRVAQTHHNCIMTKYPGHSSETQWHQDIRYWSFDRPELVSVWLALGEETARNGALSVIPGSHHAELDRGRLDAELFLRTDLEENRSMIDSAVQLELGPGDVLFFDAKLFHAAGMNRSDRVKLSAVFTYHRDDNNPIPGTRSANYPSIPLAIDD
ncbi:MAG: phytanoyl-CoA dioxygenase family protein [Pseudomonadales bacterium]|jgi:phytanoyl-CoA hydroxylase|nr:phytanoyl-CoA dioxygenase family protein [Pseudomonadales bacterium]